MKAFQGVGLCISSNKLHICFIYKSWKLSDSIQSSILQASIESYLLALKPPQEAEASPVHHSGTEHVGTSREATELGRMVAGPRDRKRDSSIRVLLPEDFMKDTMHRGSAPGMHHEPAAGPARDDYITTGTRRLTQKVDIACSLLQYTKSTVSPRPIRDGQHRIEPHCASGLAAATTARG